MGYSRAGFEVVGVDIKPQPHYPFEFYRGDALTFLGAPLRGSMFAAIHASPPCQAYSTITPDRSSHPDLYGPTRSLLERLGRPWVIENVMGAPYRQGIVLCGSMFGLKVRRHRNFEASMVMMQPECRHREQGPVLGVYGDGGATPRKRGGGRKAFRRDWPDLIGVPWADWREAAQAIPPAYTEFIGKQLMATL